MTKQKAKSQFLNRGSPEKKKKKNQECFSLYFILVSLQRMASQTYRECGVAVQFK